MSRYTEWPNLVVYWTVMAWCSFETQHTLIWYMIQHKGSFFYHFWRWFPTGSVLRCIEIPPLITTFSSTGRKQIIVQLSILSSNVFHREPDPPTFPQHRNVHTKWNECKPFFFFFFFKSIDLERRFFLSFFFYHDKVTGVNVSFHLLWGGALLGPRRKSLYQRGTNKPAPAFKNQRKKKQVLLVEKCVNMYVNHIVFTVLLMVFRRWMILLILKLNYCMLLKVYPV